MRYKAWLAKAAKQPMVLEPVDLGPLGAEDVEVAVEHCGVCHSDLSVLNNDWGISQYPAVLGHEVLGRVLVARQAPRERADESAVLQERFGLKWHWKESDATVYRLVPDAGGVKLHESAPDADAARSVRRPG